MSHFMNNPVFTGNVTAPTLNALTLAALAAGFSIAGGTSSKTFTCSNTLTLTGTDGSTLNVGTGGTLGTAAYTAATAYEAALGNPASNGYVLSSTTAGVRSWIPNSAGFANPMTTLGDIIYENSTPAAARLPGNTSTTMAVLTQTGNGSNSAIPVWTPVNGNNGILQLDGSGKVPVANLPASVTGALNYQGVWNASTNTTPTLVNGTGTKGYYYKVGTAGNTTIDGNSNWTVGDLIVFNGTTWDKIEGGGSDVVSVNGQVGAVTVAAVNQTMYLGTTALTINGGTGTQTVLAGMTSITSTTFVGNLTGNASGTSASFTGNLTGDVTSVGMSTSLAATTVVSKAITGYSAGSDLTALAATDTILQAFQKLQYQMKVGLYGNVQTKSTTYNPTLITDNVILCDASAGAFAITLLAAPTTNQEMVFKKIDATANAITINGNGKTIDGAASFTLSSQWNSITIVYNGTAWYII